MIIFLRPRFWLTKFPLFFFSLRACVEKEVMMMGKIETDTFHLHYFAPFNLVVTFGIALSSFHKKMLVK